MNCIFLNLDILLFFSEKRTVVTGGALQEGLLGKTSEEVDSKRVYLITAGAWLSAIEEVLG